MTLNRIDHFVITTKNLCQCLHFYVDILGMEHKIQREENDQHTLHFGNQKINIHTYVGEFQPTAKHAERGCADFCLITNDDINQVKKEMERNGVEVIAGIIKTEGDVYKRQVPISARLIANKVSFQFKHEAIQTLYEGLKEQVAAQEKEAEET